MNAKASKDTVLVSLYDNLSPEKKIRCMNKIKEARGRYKSLRNGGIKYFVPEKTGEEDAGRVFYLAEAFQEFGEPKLFAEGTEKAVYENGQKKKANIFCDYKGCTLVPFYVGLNPEIESVHAAFSFKWGCEVVVYHQGNELRVRLLRYEIKMINKILVSLSDEELYDDLICYALPYNFRFFSEAAKAAKEKFLCQDCVHVHFFKNKTRQ